jgi:predicted nucleic acid-binding protein
MTAECFLDANILVYCVSSAPSEAAKKARAIELIATADFGLSAQVLQEFYVTVTRKIKQTVSPDAALELMRAFSVFPMVNTTFSLIERGALLAQQFQISYWDGAIIAAAEQLSARILYSEDLNDGQTYGSVRVLNPFSREHLAQ